MYLIETKFIGAFPDGDKLVEISMANGGGGGGYMIMVDRFYWGKILKQLGGWRVVFQLPNDQYSAGDLEPLLDLVNSQTID
ncbi:MAG: hypothetical protein EOO85_18535 [Pedobacter sp.]|nr:MAG: hypothetical protein EOO85_18535 [Pedobacter sp.]